MIVIKVKTNTFEYDVWPIIIYVVLSDKFVNIIYKYYYIIFIYKYETIII